MLSNLGDSSLAGESLFKGGMRSCHDQSQKYQRRLLPKACTESANAMAYPDHASSRLVGLICQNSAWLAKSSKRSMTALMK